VGNHRRSANDLLGLILIVLLIRWLTGNCGDPVVRQFADNGVASAL
jgi:hypothetical protein